MSYGTVESTDPWEALENSENWYYILMRPMMWDEWRDDEQIAEDEEAADAEWWEVYRYMMESGE